MKNGRRRGAPPKPYEPPDTPPGEVNTTDPDSRVMKASRGWVQGYNVQTAVNENQIALAGEITVETIDFGQLSPMTDATVRELESAGVSDRPSVILADAGYWNEQHMDDVTAEHGLNVLIPHDSSRRKGPRPGWTTRGVAIVGVGAGGRTLCRRQCARPSRGGEIAKGSSDAARTERVMQRSVRFPRGRPGDDAEWHDVSSAPAPPWSPEAFMLSSAVRATETV